MFEFNPDFLLGLTRVATEPQKYKAWPQTEMGHRKSCPKEIPAQKWGGDSVCEQLLSRGVTLVCAHGIKGRHR